MSGGIAIQKVQPRLGQASKLLKVLKVTTYTSSHILGRGISYDI